MSVPTPATRFEIMPFGSAAEQACTLPERVAITVTCSPRHGIDRTVEVAAQLAEHGHDPAVHLATRQLSGPRHLDHLVERIADAGIGDLFVIAGDAATARGPYDSALPVLERLAEHPRRPARIGIGAYPEGHPLISPDTLRQALAAKAPLADYAVTQICFDPDAFLRWLTGVRASGISLPVFAGLPGAVDRKRLLEISARVGVGPSLSFLRKQKGIRRLFTRPGAATERLYDALAPLVGDTGLGLAGLHWFTFNRLLETITLDDDLAADAGRRRA